MPVEIWTVGHSNRTIGVFLDLLTAEHIACIADVRRFPGSRAHPHFNSESLAQSAQEAGIAYRHLLALGGRRHGIDAASPNTGWRVQAFNAYADYMSSPEFAVGLQSLIDLGERQRTVIMCSEAVPWRCHRRLIADALLVRGWAVWDIMGPGQVKPHALTSFAKLSSGRLTYPAPSLFPEL